MRATGILKALGSPNPCKIIRTRARLEAIGTPLQQLDPREFSRGSGAEMPNSIRSVELCETGIMIGEWPTLPKRRIVRSPPERARSIDTGHHLCRSTRHPCINITRLVEDASHQDRYRRCRSSRRHPTTTESPATSGSASEINCSAAGSARRTEAFLWYV